ncbi:MAG: YihY family inner membrane protein [Rhodospirillaceae bacterium]|nr:YihY family inner membrane protein [Rhodospirillaceae bacterium]
MTLANEDTKNLPFIQKLRPVVLQCGRFLAFVVGRMRDDQVNRVAASLSYTSTLALVPALALTLAILAAFPAFSGLRDSVLDLILSNFIPDTGMRMNEAIESFISAAGRLTTIGVVGLIVTSVLLLLTIEGAFNRIFRVARPRPIMARLVVFWTVITVSPLLVGLSFSLSGYFLTIRTLLGGEEPGAFSVLLGAAMPTVLSAAAFALIYTAVPNRRVRIGDAFLGGLIAALLFASLRYGFTSFVAGMPTYQAIYGAVAALPVFLIWLFLSWNVILAGAVMTAALPDWRRAEHERTSGPGGRLALATDILAALYAVAGSVAGLVQRALRQEVGVKEAALIPVLEELRAGGFAAFGDDGVWRLGRDLGRTSISEIVHLLGYGVPLTPALTGRSQAVTRLSRVIADAQANEKQILSQPIASLFEETPTDDH